MSYTTGTTNIDEQTISDQQQMLEEWLVRICGKFPDAISWAIALEAAAGKIRRQCAEQGKSAETA